MWRGEDTKREIWPEVGWMIYVGIDPGTHMGIAVLDKNSNILYAKTSNFTRKKNEETKDQFLAIYNKINELIDWIILQILNIDITKELLICYEKVSRHIGTAAAHMYGGIIAIIQLICANRNIHCACVYVMSIKKLAIGSGKASKQDMIDSAIKKWGIIPEDDNTADALWIAQSALLNNNNPT